MGIHADQASLLSLLLEAILFGIFLTLFLVMVVMLWDRSRGARTQKQLAIPLGTVMLVIAAAHLVVGFIHNMKGFIWISRSESCDVVAFFLEIADPLSMGTTSLYAVQTCIGDAVLVWRFYAMYGTRRYVVFFLIALWAATLGVAIPGLYFLAKAGQDVNIFATSSTFVMALWVLTMINCIICTGAIAWKVYKTGRASQVTRTRSLWPIILAFVESGALYTFAVAAFMVSYLSDTPGYYCVIDSTASLIGITFCLIVLRIRYHLDSPIPTIRTTVRTANNNEVGVFVVAPRRTSGEIPVSQQSLDDFQMHTVDRQATQSGTEGENSSVGKGRKIADQV